MGSASRGSRRSGFNMGAAQNYYADMMQRQPRRGFNFTRDPDTSPGLSYDRRTFRQRAADAAKDREKRLKEFDERQSKERASYEDRYPAAPEAVGISENLGDYGLARPELDVPPPEAPKKAPFFVSDVRFGDFGIYSPKDYPDSYSIGIEGETENQKFSLYDTLDKAEAYINKLRAQKDKDPTSYTVLDYDKKGKFRGYDPRKASSSTGTLLDDPGAVKERQGSVSVDIPPSIDYAPGKEKNEPEPVRFGEGSEVGVFSGGRSAKFQEFLDKAKADRDKFVSTLKSEERNFGQADKTARAQAAQNFRRELRQRRESMERARGRRSGTGGFMGRGPIGGNLGDSRGPIGGDFGGGRLAGGGVRGPRGSRGSRGAGGGGRAVRGAR